MPTGTLTTGEVARRLNLSAERVRQLARTGALDFELTGLGRLFSEDAVAAYAAARCRYQRSAACAGGDDE